jgi:hypothetical protein
MAAVDYGPTYLLGAGFYQPRFLYVNLYRFILMSLGETVVMNNIVLIFFYERVFCVRLVPFILRGFGLRRSLQVCLIIVTGPVSF